MPTDAAMRERIVVIGASVAGLAACEALRVGGFDGELALVGAERHVPYDRPPLSKQLLLGTMDAGDIVLRQQPELDALEIDLHLGYAATALDVASRTVTLDDGTTLAGSALVVATGSKPARLPGQPLEPPFFELRTLDDALALRDALPRAERLVIVGAGFIGMEVAAAARAGGCAVTVVEAAEYPLSRVLRPDVAAPLRTLHEDRGVEIRCGMQVARLACHWSGAALVTLRDGTVLEADAALVGVGATPAVGWLADSGLDVRGGVRCDAGLLAAPSVWAIGDLACWAHPLFGTIRVEHWTTARDHARVAAHNALSALRADRELEIASAVPYFWSDQYDVKIQMVGWPVGADTIENVNEEDRRLYRFRRAGRLVAALTWNWPRQIALERRAIERHNDPAAAARVTQLA